ncbi:MAG: DUF359 domain-containing protein [Candidatus Micrarchaeaceae archaeon]
MAKHFSFEGELRLPHYMRPELGRVYGKIIKEAEIPGYVRKAVKVYAVGDMVVSTLLNLGCVPDVAVFDFAIGRRRVALRNIKETYSKPVMVRNRAGTISRDLWKAVERATLSGKKVGIRVYGEEDLAAVVCAYLAPNGSLLIYGMPEKGLHILKAGADTRKLARNILERMRGSA